MRGRKFTGRGHHHQHFNGSITLEHWNRLREEIYERDGWRCQAILEDGTKCLKTEVEQWEETKGLGGRGRTFDCHHKNGQPDDNRRPNLLTVCTKCHRDLHPYRSDIEWTRYYGKQPDEWNGEDE